MAPRDLTYRDAVEIVTAEIVQFKVFLDDGLRVGEAAAAMRLDAWTARQYEDAISRIRRLDVGMDTTLQQLLQLAVSTVRPAEALTATRSHAHEPATP
jgi:hypothetical protein